ncbi:ACT domain-containing protein [Desulfovibrio mangrovi]|uniref:ACT domain-containing protein n=1 Tax=Desulfovibrio mangrovi TaxID=2976983 RepID=UPI002246DCB9|nr:ACT domain-containing protein [Desulfovibrio mangrovi]UZP68450.1 ACT domain-containing protein [Desulfovibrio mangrovi]
MKVEQISVFLENKAGRLAEVTRTLTDANINIRALSLADTSDFGILRLIVSDHERAKAVLKENGFTVGRTTVVAVEVDDKPGGLNHILSTLSANGVNVEYMYAFVQQGGQNATLIFRFDRTDQALEILQKHNIPIVPGEKLYEN